jgi:glycosyltransferase involved in cell wall biosynthesis
MNPPPPALEEIWCGIPVYNNAATIVGVAQRCRAQHANVLVIDDGSTDADLRELLKALDVHVIRHAANLGKGAALLTAFDYARQHGGRHLVALDGDGQHFPEDIPRLIAHLEYDTIVVGCRQEIVGTMPRSSRFGQEFSDFWILVETGHVVRDTQSGFRAYPLPQMSALHLGSRHYNFEVEVITRALWAGLRAQAVPIRVSYPEASERVSSFRPLLDNVRLSWLHFRLVLRQLLPIPHRRIATDSRPVVRTPGQWLRCFWTINAGPLGLAAATGLGLLLGIVLWPYGAVVVLYIAWRLHINKIAALASVVLASLLLPPDLCYAIGQRLFHGGTPGRLAWFVGSHIVAFLVSPVLALLVYAVACRVQQRAPALRSDHEHR